MQEENKEKGIILKVKNYSVSDKLITLISDSGKKYTHILKSIKSPKSRKAHAVDICNLVELKKKSGYSMEMVTDIKLLDEFEELKRDPRGLFYIQGLCEIVDNFAYEEVENEELFKDLITLLRHSNGNNYKFKIAILIIRHIQESGYMPEVPEFNADISANSDSPGLFVGNGEYDISEEEYKVIKCILEREVTFSCKVKPSPISINRIYSLAVSWYENITEKKFNSGIFIK
jgi:DNA repair protein RecO